MPDQNLSSGMKNIARNGNIMLTVGIIIILGVMILPLPSFLLDLLLVMNITTALVILFIALFVLRPMDFSVFPGVLLITTLFRLALNIATTRLVLSEGYAGEIIEAFGSFVVQGNYVVGTVIFFILIIINFVVITKGATRIAEVSARFTLDAMPGKQMSIDADLNAGLIDDREAQKRRETIAQEADFYGAMDGASKFIRGDAIAAMLITLVNVVGGLLIGVLQRGLPIGEAATIYVLLTIGDGLVAQIPALIISTAAGIVITRASSVSSMGSQIASQVISQPHAIAASAGVLGIMAFMPGLPTIPFALMAITLGFLAQQIKTVQKKELERQAEQEVTSIPEPVEKIEEFLHPDPFEIELGYGLIPLVDADQGGNLLGRITTIRKSIAIEMGVLIPAIRIRDNIQLNANDYIFKVYGIEIARGQVMMDRYMVVNPDDDLELEGVRMTEPTFGLPSIWVSEKEKEKAEIMGNTVVEAPAVIATHLMEVLKNNCFKLLDRQETQRMLDHLKETHKALVEGLVPEVVPLGVVRATLRNLLQEKLPIRNMVTILETIADYAAFTKDADILTEYVRSALSETVSDLLRGVNSKAVVGMFEPKLEDHVLSVTKNGTTISQNLGFSPQQVNQIFEKMAELIDQMASMGVRPAFLVSPQIRRTVRRFIESVFPNVFVISYSELMADTELKSVGVVSYPHAA
jgi:flagellar biosynthesis protein FlhA